MPDVLHLQSPLGPEELEVLSRGRTRLRGHRGSGGAGGGLPSNCHMHLAKSAPWGGGATGSNIYTLPFAKELLLWTARRDSILHGALGAPCSGVAGGLYLLVPGWGEHWAPCPPFLLSG